MVTYEGYMQIKILHKQGKSLRAIACEVGCSVNTVRKYLAEGSAPKRQGRPARPAKVAAHEDYLRQRVAAASPDWIPATVLWREIAQMGRQHDPDRPGHDSVCTSTDSTGGRSRTIGLQLSPESAEA